MHHPYVSFVLASIVLLLIPGPAVLFIVSRSVEQGARAGIVSVSGITMGGLVHVLFAVCGLSALLAASAVAFSAVKYAGAAYLIYLGISKFLEKPKPKVKVARAKTELSKLFWQGFVVQILNPKIAIFFLSFLPQFVDPAEGSAPAQLLLLGLAFVALAFVSDSTYALLAGKIAQRMSGSSSMPRFGKWAAGITYLSLGVATAASGSSRATK